MSHWPSTPVRFRGGVESLEPRHMLSAMPVISEFMARNDTFLGDAGTGPPGHPDWPPGHPDWIEIYNAGDETVDLAGWYLTDNLQRLDKWRFPDVRLPPDEYLVVFASGQGVPDSMGNLHTNFKLKGKAGEFLGLVMPDGETVAHQYGPTFPLQAKDVSFGIPQATIIPLVLDSADVEYLVPDEAGQLDAFWNQPDFVDTEEIWTPVEGGNGIGYFLSGSDPETPLRADIRQSMHQRNGSVFVRIPFDVPMVSDVDGLQVDITYDDGFVAYLNGVEVARAEAPDAVEWDSVAIAERSDDGLRHQWVDLSARRELLTETDNVLAIHGLNAASDDDEFYVRATLDGLRVYDEILLDIPDVLSVPTPGALNRTHLGRLHEPLTFSRRSGPFLSRVTLELSVPVPGAKIYYTTDGGIPVVDADGNLHNGLSYDGSPITIDETTIVTARAYDGAFATVPSSARYVKVQSDIARNAELPLLAIDAFGGNQVLPTPVSASVFYSVEGEAADPAEFTGTVALAPWDPSPSPSKQPYTLQIVGDDTEAARVSLLGMPEGSDWLLQAPSTERPLLRSVLALGWSNAMGVIDRYTPQTRLVDLYLNTNGDDVDSSDYAGVYVLTESVRVDENRVNIASLDPNDIAEPDISGGYLLKYDDAPADATVDSFLSTDRIGQILYVEPAGDALVPDQRQWLEDYIEEFEDVLFGPGFDDPVSGYAKYIDVDAWIDYHIVSDALTKNQGAFVADTFFYKDRGGKLTMGPLWDFEHAMDGSPEGFWGDDLAQRPPEQQLKYAVWQRLFEDPEFDQRYRTRWFELREGPFRTDKLLADIEANATFPRGPASEGPTAGDANRDGQFDQRDIVRVLQGGKYLTGRDATFADGDWNGDQRFDQLDLVAALQTDAYLQFQRELARAKAWIADRVTWVDRQLESGFVAPPEFSFDVLQVSMSVPGSEGQILYTVDGSDPKYAETARRLYTGPILISDTTTFAARVRVGDTWSARRDATFTTHRRADATNFRITEINYNPSDPTQNETLVMADVNNDDFEFLEFANIGRETIHVGNVRIVEGVEYGFPAVDLGPGERVVVVNDLEAFELRYGGNANIRVMEPSYGDWRLSNSGERIRVEDASGNVIQDFQYHDYWYPSTNGGGFSLAVVDICGNYDFSGNWQPSQQAGGSPGRPEPLETSESCGP